MRLLDILTPDRVTVDLSASSKDEVLWAVSGLFAHGDPTLTAEAVHEVLAEREKLASTGVGSGVAIPHGRIGSIDRLRAAVAVCPRGVPFDAIDGAPVHIVVAVLAPSHHTGDHLRVLARVSRLLRSQELRGSVLQAESAQAAYESLAEADRRV